MFSVLLAAILSVFVGPSVSPPDPAPAFLAGRLISLLGDDDFDTRERAEAAIPGYGAGMHRPLVEAACGRDPEIARRANRILRKHYDAVDFGVSGGSAPRLVDAAGPRQWRLVERTVKKADGSTSVVSDVRWLPDEGRVRSLAERYGRLVMTDAGEQIGEAGSKESDDPLSGPTQSAATLRLFRDLQLAGWRPWVLKAMAAHLDLVAISDYGP